jgi:acyl carrier protein
MRDVVYEIVRDALDDLNSELGYEELKQIAGDTVLHGGETGLDSLSLVSLIVDVEGRVAQALGRQVVLADEKAMSQKNSPYRTVDTLVDFVVKCLEADRG